MGSPLNGVHKSSCPCHAAWKHLLSSHVTEMGKGTSNVSLVHGVLEDLVDPWAGICHLLFSHRKYS